MQNNTESNIQVNQLVERPTIFDYSDYRKFLKDSFEYKKSKNPLYSETAFIKRAGLGDNSRGYLGLVVRGKRNLSARTVAGFTNALALKEKESLYFEALVYFNQSKTEKDKKIYLDRLEAYSKNRKSKAVDLLKSQYNYFANWYLVAIRELIGLDDFNEEPLWIKNALRGKVTQKQVKDAIEDLVNLGLVDRSEDGKLEQSVEAVEFQDTSMNYTVVSKFHTQILDRAKDALEEDDYQDRSSSCVVLCTDSKNFENIREDIKEFRQLIVNKYGVTAEEADNDCVLTLGVQLFHTTPVNKNRRI